MLANSSDGENDDETRFPSAKIRRVEQPGENVDMRALTIHERSKFLAYKVQRDEGGNIVQLLVREGQCDLGIGSKDMFELLDTATIVLDRTPFTEEFLTSKFFCLAISFLARAGKTTALDTIEMFAGKKYNMALEAEVRRIFTEEWIGFKITENEQLMEEVFQQVPVVRVDFTDQKCSTYAESLEAIREAVFKAYEKHRGAAKLLVELLATKRMDDPDSTTIEQLLLAATSIYPHFGKTAIDNLEELVQEQWEQARDDREKRRLQRLMESNQRLLAQIKRVLEGEDTKTLETRLEWSINYLCKILFFVHNNRTAIVLFDEVESPLHRLVRASCATEEEERRQESDLKKLRQLLNAIMYRTFKANDCCGRGLSLSVLPLAPSSSSNNFITYSRAELNPFAKDFHILGEAFEHLCDELGFREEALKTGAIVLYDGFKLPAAINDIGLNTWSALNYLSKLQGLAESEYSSAFRSYYWDAGSALIDLSQLLSHDLVATRLRALLWGEESDVNSEVNVSISPFVLEDFITLYRLCNRGQPPSRIDANDTITKYLFHTGLLERTDEAEVDSSWLVASIPNREASDLLEKALLKKSSLDGVEINPELAAVAAAILFRLYLEPVEAEYAKAMTELFADWIASKHSRELHEKECTFLSRYVLGLCQSSNRPSMLKGIYRNKKLAAEADLVGRTFSNSARFLRRMRHTRQVDSGQIGMIQEHKFERGPQSSEAIAKKLENAGWQGIGYSDEFLNEEPPIEDIVYVAVLFIEARPGEVHVRRVTMSEFLRGHFPTLGAALNSPAERAKLMKWILDKFQAKKPKERSFKEGEHKVNLEKAIEEVKLELGNLPEHA